MDKPADTVTSEDRDKSWLRSNSEAIEPMSQLPQLEHRDIDETIALHRERLEQLHSSHPDRATTLKKLEMALSARFEHLDRYEDLYEAISSQREALALQPASHPGRSMFPSSNFSSDLAMTPLAQDHLSLHKNSY
jgi:chromosome segregation ATPase